MKRVESPGYGGRVSPFVGSTTVVTRPSSVRRIGRSRHRNERKPPDVGVTIRQVSNRLNVNNRNH